MRGGKIEKKESLLLSILILKTLVKIIMKLLIDLLDRHNMGATFFSCILPIIKLIFLFPFIYHLSLSELQVAERVVINY